MEWTEYPAAGDQAVHTVVGTMRMLAGLESPQLGNRRDILAYLPPSYTTGERRYPVLYMHDGQNLFDNATAFSGEWHVDATMEEASRAGLEAIVIGIPNLGEARLNEYSPFADAQGRGGQGDAYLDFVVDTLKPLVDQEFRTLPERAATGILGSSMGGLISIYAFFRRPEVFGFAGVMSPSLWFADRAIFDFVKEAPYNEGRIYMDVGSQEGMEAVRDVRRMRRVLMSKGYDTGSKFCYLEDAGAQHTESAWAGRLRGALEFLVPHTDTPTAPDAAKI